MSLPKSVRNQAQAAAKHFETPEGNTDEATHTADDSTPQEEDRNPQAEGQEAKPTDDTQPADPPKDSPKDDPPKDQDALYWRHRHDVIQGKYNKEVPALHAEVRQLKQDNADKDSRIKELESQAQPSHDASGGPGNAQIEQFREEFGEELVDFVQRMIDAKGSGQAPDIDPSRVEELDQRVSRFEQEQQADAEARFWTDLQQAVSDWRTINQDPQFHEFLAQFDSSSGKQRQAMLSEAQNALDAKGVIDIFQLYKSQQSSSPRQGRQIPEEDVEPRTAQTTTDTPQGGGNKRIWTGADISRFYKQKASGRLDPKEAERLEADIFAAQREGRVR